MDTRAEDLETGLDRREGNVGVVGKWMIFKVAGLGGVLGGQLRKASCCDGASSLQKVCRHSVWDMLGLQQGALGLSDGGHVNK